MKQNQTSWRQKASGIWNAVKKFGAKPKRKSSGSEVCSVSWFWSLGGTWVTHPTHSHSTKVSLCPKSSLSIPILGEWIRKPKLAKDFLTFPKVSDIENDSLQPCLVFRIPLASYMEDFFYHATSSLIGGNVEPGHVGPETGARNNWRLWDCDRDICRQCESVKKSEKITFVL